MSDEGTDKFEAVWSHDVDTEHLGEVLIQMGAALKDQETSIIDGRSSGIGLRNVTFNQENEHDEFGEATLEITYTKGLDTILGNPIKYTENAAGE